jgi:hypothetical protein
LSPVEKTADDALHTKVSPEQTAKADAVKFLSEVVATGPVKVMHIEKEARTACLLGAHQRALLDVLARYPPARIA